jgi:hypothetical protein
VSEGPDSTHDLAVAAAARLRLVQADFADEDADVRRSYIREELERALTRVPPGERLAFLKHLVGSFPVWSDPPDRPAATPQVAPPPADDARLSDPDFLVGRLAELARELPAGTRAQLGRRLQEAGLTGANVEGWPEKETRALTSALHVPAGAPLDPGRVAGLLALLAGFASNLDQLVWSTWRRLAPRSGVQRPGELRDTMRQFTQGAETGARDKVAADLELLRRLTAALVSSVSRVGPQFAKQSVSRFSPSQIEWAVKNEGGGILLSREVRCWRKYAELAESLDEATVEAEIMEIIVESAESLLAGLGG